MRIFGNNTLLDLYRFGYHTLQLGKVGLGKVEAHKLCPMFIVRDKTMLQHLGIARADVVVVESIEKLCVDDDKLAVGEHTNLVLQSAKVDASLSSNRCVDHGKQRGRDIYKVDATLEGRCRKATKVGNHAATKVNHQRMACCATLAKSRPHLGKRVECLVSIACLYHYRLCPFKAEKVLKLWQTHVVCGLVGKNKYLVVLAFGYSINEVALEIS